MDERIRQFIDSETYRALDGLLKDISDLSMGTSRESRIFSEADRRLKALVSDYINCMEISERFFSAGIEGSVSFNEDFQTFYIFCNGLPQPFFTINNGVRGGGQEAEIIYSENFFTAGERESVAPELEDELIPRLEAFYYNANRAWSSLEKGIFGRKKSKYIGIVMVRNRLIDHAEYGQLDTFGVSRGNGPRVKPLKIGSGDQEVDPGLRTNFEERVREMRRRIDDLLGQQP